MGLCKQRGWPCWPSQLYTFNFQRTVKLAMAEEEKATQPGQASGRPASLRISAHCLLSCQDSPAQGLTKAVQDVVEVVEIVVALFHHGPVPDGVVHPAIGVCHSAGTVQEMGHTQHKQINGVGGASYLLARSTFPWGELGSPIYIPKAPFPTVT